MYIKETKEFLELAKYLAAASDTITTDCFADLLKDVVAHYRIRHVDVYEDREEFVESLPEDIQGFLHREEEWTGIPFGGHFETHVLFEKDGKPNYNGPIVVTHEDDTIGTIREDFASELILARN